MSSGVLPLLLFVIAALLAVLTVLLLNRLRTSRGEAASRESLYEFQARIQQDLAGIKTSLQEEVLNLSQKMNDQLKQSAHFLIETDKGYQETVSRVSMKLGELQQATHTIMDLGKDMSSLQKILSAPKLRGGVGELFLAELLRQILPAEHYGLQHTFRNGLRVDAVIFLGDGLIPVDAKFPYENFKKMLEASNPDEEKIAKKMFTQDVKKHIDQIAEKYILPEEGTFEFALMYIPAENVYYETIIKDEAQSESLSSYALQRKVVPVSPNSFYAYLQAIVRGLKGFRIERSAQVILEGLGQLDSDLQKCIGDLEKLGGHLSNASSSYDKFLKKFDRFKDRVSSLSGHTQITESNETAALLHE